MDEHISTALISSMLPMEMTPQLVSEQPEAHISTSFCMVLRVPHEIVLVSMMVFRTKASSAVHGFL